MFRVSFGIWDVQLRYSKHNSPFNSQDRCCVCTTFIVQSCELITKYFGIDWDFQRIKIFVNNNCISNSELSTSGKKSVCSRVD